MTKASYTEMVDPAARDGAGSGIEWIGKIPKGWEVRKLKYGSDLINGYSFDSNTYVDDGFPIIRISDVGQEIDFDDVKRIPYDIADSISKFKIVNGDILIAMTGATIGKSSLFNYDQDCYLNQRVGIIRAKNLLDQKYLYYFVGSNIFRENIDLACAGGAQENIGKPELGEIILSLPPLETQQTIASYLDTKTAQIEQAISLKTQQIKMLQEKRTALINHVVTKGLDPDVEFVDSGIEWIGTIPKRWEVRKIRSLLMKKEIEYQDGNHGELHPKSEDYEDEGIPFIMASDVRDNKINFENCKKIPKHKTDKLRIGYSHTGDVLFTHKGTIGEVAIVPQLNSDYIMLTPQVTYYRVLNNQLLNNKYLAAFFSAPIFKNQLDLICSMQSTRDYIGLIAQKNLIIVIPSIGEQEKISSYLDNETVQIDNIISLIQQSIDLLVEYKQSLISHVVTGKVKVG